MINLSMAEPEALLHPRITVIGVGGGGGNAINNMIRSNLEGCEFIVANTDSQALAQSLASRKIQLGINLSRGLGAGSKPNIGCAAAEEALADIMSVLDGSDMLFVTAGMGGGTGTGAAPVIARAARDSGILTVGVVTRPFHFEGTHRMRQAESGIAELQKYVDTLIVIPNQNLFRIANERTTFAEAFRMADEVLHSGVRGITDLMVMPGFMNLDFADVKTVMGEMGKAMMGTGEATGDNRAIEAAEAAISNPLLDDISMKGARGVLINITGGLDMTLFEVDQAANRIREEVDPEAQIKVGSTIGDGLEGRIRVSVIATGIEADAMIHSKAAGSAGVTPRVSEAVTPAPRPATRAAAAIQESVVTQRSSTSSAPLQQPASRQYYQPIEAQEDSVSKPQVATQSQPQPKANYFTMPSAMSPGVSAPHMAASPVTMRVHETSVHTAEPSSKAVPSTSYAERVAAQAQAYQEPVIETSRVRETFSKMQSIVEEEEAASDFDEVQDVPPSSMVRSAVPPVREIPPVQQAQRQRTAQASTSPATRSTVQDQDVRITQLTTATPAQPASTSSSSHGPGRAQSLFQRITGFGMIRPSAHRDTDDDLEDLAGLPVKAQPVMESEPSDREPLSKGDADMLDIPAFLRRQSNH
ncbi:MAG: cell division protein FtsZ [Proteobacteria bacterium]|jgi:cell division protein FtsZ|nr:cell division protein FtsZ [Alphaproteobacteria bacterium]NCC03014.1 cell division protein FtsZ [Pseudomonadota bacterium]